MEREACLLLLSASLMETGSQQAVGNAAGKPRAVTLAVCGIFHYRKYVGELSSRGCLRDFFYSHLIGTTGRSLGISSGRAVNLWFKEYLYRGSAKLAGGSPPDWVADFAHASWDAGVARRLRPGGIFHGMLHGNLLRSFHTARRLGKLTVGEPVNTHPLVVRDIIHEEHTLLGIPPPRGDATSLAILDELQACDYLLAGSKLIRDSYVARGFPGDRAFVIPYAIDTARFHPLTPDERAAVRDTRFRVLCVAQVVPRKGIHYLLDAWERLGLTTAEAELVLIGQVGPGMAGVLSRHAGRFTHIPKVAHDRLRIEYGRADVFVLPSVEDGFGYVTTEAMGCGLPVITTSAAGSSDVVEDGVNGFVVPPRSADALTDRLDRLRRDPDLRRVMGQNNVAASKMGCTWAGYVDSLVELYGSLPATARTGFSQQ